MEDQSTEDVGNCVTFFATNADVEARQQYVKVLLQILDKPIQVIRNDIHKITSTLLLVSEDTEKSVRLSLVTRIPEIYMRCREISVPEFDFFLNDRLLEIVLRYLQDAEVEVSSKAYVTTMSLLQKRLLSKEAIEQKLCPAVVELSRMTVVHPAHQVDYETNAIELMKLMAPIVGAEKTREHLIDRFLEMCSVEMHFVRKSCAEYFPVFCQVLGTELTESLLLPVFLRLCEDGVWGVRKTSAGSLLKVALMCTLESRRTRLAPMVYRLLNDQSRWVGMIAFESLGQFISLFAEPCITGLAYSELGDLYIMNAANPDFKHHCNGSLIENYAHYERIFEHSLTPDDTTTAVQRPPSPNACIHQLNRTANNNNCCLKPDGDEPNVLKQFLAPLQYDEVCVSTIEKIGKELEVFYAQTTASLAADTAAEVERVSAAAFDVDVEAEVGAADVDNVGDLDAQRALNNNTVLPDGTTSTTPAAIPDDDANVELLLPPPPPPSSSSSSPHSPQLPPVPSSRTSTGHINSNIINNNVHTSNDNNNENHNEDSDDDDATAARLQESTDNNVVEDSSSTTKLPAANAVDDEAPPAEANTAGGNNRKHQQHGKNKRKSKSKAKAKAAAAAATQQLSTNSHTNALTVSSTEAASSTATNTTTTTTTTTTPSNASDCNSSSSTASTPLLRKHTPADLPQIIKQAIETKTDSSPAIATSNQKRRPTSLNTALANEPPPPETPSIEASPLAPIQFHIQAPRVDAPADDEDTLNLLQYLDRNDCNATSTLDDDAAPEFATYHYWHLEPVVPHALAAELEAAVAGTKADYTLKLSGGGTMVPDESDDADWQDDDEEDDDEDGAADDDADDNEATDDSENNSDGNGDGQSDSSSSSNSSAGGRKFRNAPLLSHMFQRVTMNDIYSESNGLSGAASSRTTMGGARHAADSSADTTIDRSWSDQMLALQGSSVTVADAVVSPPGVVVTASNTSDSSGDDGTSSAAAAVAGMHDADPANVPFVQPIVPGYLLRYYVSMVGFNDGLMNMHCAYNFPAVVLTLGRRHWQLAFELLKLLCDDLQWKIRRTVAVFIYQIALIIGRELAGRDLVPLYLGFFKDLDEVKIEALRNLTNFLRVVDVRHHHLIVFRLGSCLNNYANNYANWRFREELAQQVLNLIRLYGNVYNADGMTFLVGVAINLLSDEVCSVREIAQNAIVATFKICAPCDTDDLIGLLTDDFASHAFWRKRQMYISICYKLIAEQALSYEVFESRLIGSLLPLANDPVPNIRLNVAKLLSRMLLNHEYFVTRPVHEQIVLIVEQLRVDSDRDVRYMAKADRLDGGGSDYGDDSESGGNETHSTFEGGAAEAEADADVTPPADDLW